MEGFPRLHTRRGLNEKGGGGWEDTWKLNKKCSEEWRRLSLYANAVDIVSEESGHSPVQVSVDFSPFLISAIPSSQPFIT